jgi:hypothetical protein
MSRVAVRELDPQLGKTSLSEQEHMATPPCAGPAAQTNLEVQESSFAKPKHEEISDQDAER